MPRDSRMSRLLHVLIHMGRHRDRVTSDDIAGMLGTNPVMVRRMMAGLRDRRLVAASKGHGGGWQLSCDLEAVTLFDVYQSIGEPPLFNIGTRADQPDCGVEQAVRARMGATMAEAEALLRKRFAEISVADVAADVQAETDARSAATQE